MSIYDDKYSHKFYCIECGDFIKEVEISVMGIPNLLTCDECQKALDILEDRKKQRWIKKRDIILNSIKKRKREKK